MSDAFDNEKLNNELPEIAEELGELSGELPYTIDAKGRMSFPPRFKKVFGDRFILTRGADHRLTVYPVEKWRTFVNKISAMDFGREKELLTQIYIKGAIPVECDKMGRILIPQALREYAGLVKDVYVVGAIDIVEIWDKAAYESVIQNISQQELYAAMAFMKG